MEFRDPIRWLTIADVEHYYVHLATGFAIGAINSEAFRMAMEAFKFRDDADRYWTIGAQSGEWYVRQGDRWVRGNPPAALLGPDIPLMPLPDDLLAGGDLPGDGGNDLPETSTGGDDLPDDLLRTDLPDDLLRANDRPGDFPADVARHLRCRSCGAEIDLGDRFCTHCGTPAVQA